MILLKKLTWSNCFSYGEGNSLSLDAETVTQILGTNGVGKSSIPLIIEEVLYNKNSKGVKKADIPNRYNNNGYSISLSFEKEGIEYLVEVSRGTKLKVVLTKDGEDISSHTATNTYKTIRDIIGIEFKTFSQLVYQSTNASLQFLSATDTNRKKFLIELLHLENYLVLLDVFKEAHKDLVLKTRGIRTEVDLIEGWLRMNKLENTIPQPLLELDIDTEEDEKVLGSLTKDFETVSEKNAKITKNNTYKDMLDKIDTSIFTDVTPPKPGNTKGCRASLGAHTAAKKQAEAAITNLNSLMDECPTCLQQIDAAFKEELISAETALANRADLDIQNLTRKIKEIEADNETYNRYNDTQRDWESLYRSVDASLQTYLVDKEELAGRITVLRSRLRDSRSAISKIVAENQSRAGHNARIQIIQEQTDVYLAKLTTAQSFLSEHDSIIANLEVLKKSFGTNGILAYKIENMVKDLEDLGNKYLAELAEGRFTLEFLVSNDKLNVQITDNGNIVDITALSSGELARVNTAVLIAIRKLMSSISKSRINVLFLDEVIAVLDDTGRENLVELLLKEDGLNTYIVSHQWEHPLLAKLDIVKESGISRIES